MARRTVHRRNYDVLGKNPARRTGFDQKIEPDNENDELPKNKTDKRPYSVDNRPHRKNFDVFESEDRQELRNAIFGKTGFVGKITVANPTPKRAFGVRGLNYENPSFLQRPRDQFQNVQNLFLGLMLQDVLHENNVVEIRFFLQKFIDVGSLDIFYPHFFSGPPLPQPKSPIFALFSLGRNFPKYFCQIGNCLLIAPRPKSPYNCPVWVEMYFS